MSKLKFKLKPFTFVLILLSIIFCLAGCSQVEYTTYINNDGTINEYLNITLDQKTLEQYSFNIEVEKLNIQTFAKNTAENLISEYEQSLLVEYQQTKLTQEEYNYYTKNISVIEQDWKNNSYLIGLQFNTRESYNKYYQLLNTDNKTFGSEQAVEKKFTTTTYYYRVSNYAKYGMFGKIHEYYSTRYNTISEKSALKYSYMVPSKRFHSNADSISIDNNGNYIHTWNIEPENLDRQLYFYTVKANTGFWISICIVISLIITGTLCIVAIWKSEPKKIETEENKSENTSQ